MMRKGFAFLVIVLALTALACGALNLNPEDIANNFAGTLLATSGLGDAEGLVQTMIAGGLDEDAVSTMMASGEFGDTQATLEALGSEFSGGASGEILLQDDFSDTSSGWSETTFSEGASGYQNGEYRILVTSPLYSVWDYPNQDFYEDVRVEVDAHRIGGPNDIEYGLLCRHSNVENFYFGSITVDGYFAISRRINGGEYEYVGMDSYQINNAINVGDATNHLRFDCVGSTLTLYANGVLLASVTDTALTTGDVGVYAGTFDTGGAEILFDNFTVYQP
jgi:hypothetical protein